MEDIAVVGWGTVPRHVVLKSVERVVGEASGGARLLVPISDDQPRAALWAAEWAQVRDIPTYVWVDAEEMDERQDSVWQSSVRETAGSSEDLVRTLREGSTLLVAWDDEDPRGQALVSEAVSRGCRALDLQDLVEFVDEEEEEDDPPAGPFPTVYVEDDLDRRVAEVMGRAAEEVARIVREAVEGIAASVVPEPSKR